MESIQIRDAKAKFSALVEDAEHGRPTTITRHGRPAAVMIPIADARRLYPDDRRSFADLLLAFPGGVEFVRLSRITPWPVSARITKLPSGLTSPAMARPGSGSHSFTGSGVSFRQQRALPDS